MTSLWMLAAAATLALVAFYLERAALTIEADDVRSYRNDIVEHAKGDVR